MCNLILDGWKQTLVVLVWRKIGVKWKPASKGISTHTLTANSATIRFASGYQQHQQARLWLNLLLSQHRPRWGPATSQTKPIMIGIFGVEHVDKLALFRVLRTRLDQKQYIIWDAADAVKDAIPKTVDQIQDSKSPEQRRKEWRERSIREMQGQCRDNGSVGIISGHHITREIFKGEDHFNVITTIGEWECYTHIVCLEGKVVDLAT